MKNILLSTILSLLIFGCNNTPTSTAVSPKKVIPAAQPQSQSTILLKGHYVWGAEVNTFRPCGNDKTFWVDGNAASVKELELKYQALAKKPYEETFAVVSGNLGDRDLKSEGFDAVYDGLITIEKVHSLAISSSSDCK